MFFHICISFLLFLSFLLHFCFFMPFAVFSIPVPFLWSCSALFFYNTFNLLSYIWEFPWLTQSSMFTCFLAGMSCASKDETYSGAAILNFALPNQLGGVGTDLRLGCWMFLLPARFEEGANEPSSRNESSSGHSSPVVLQVLLIILWSHRWNWTWGQRPEASSILCTNHYAFDRPASKWVMSSAGHSKGFLGQVAKHSSLSRLFWIHADIVEFRWSRSQCCMSFFTQGCNPTAHAWKQIWTKALGLAVFPCWLIYVAACR